MSDHIETTPLTSAIGQFCADRIAEFDQIPAARQEQLLRLSQYCSRTIAAGHRPRIIVICTHNSRRSHLGQVWLSAGADHYGIPGVETFSGGTEATAFNPRAVEALRRIGFLIETEDFTENPIYQIRWNDRMEPYRAFSKKYDTAPNPTERFAAVMVCSEADEGCPLVAGCDFRLALPYDDPKAFDETPQESAKYDERARQIGREMLFVMSRVAV